MNTPDTPIVHEDERAHVCPSLHCTTKIVATKDGEPFATAEVTKRDLVLVSEDDAPTFQRAPSPLQVGMSV